MQQESGASRALENAVVRLLKTRPFYGHFLLGFRRRAAPGEHPLGVTIAQGVPTLCVDPVRFGHVDAVAQGALLEHVLKHVLHLHVARGKERNCRLWDIAADLAINPGIEGLPPQAPRPEHLRFEEGLAAEEYYALLESSFDLGNLEGAGIGRAERDCGGDVERGGEVSHDAEQAAPLDDHRIWSEADSTPERLAEESVRSMVREAWRKCRGEIPGDLRTLVEGWLAPSPVPWRAVLRQFVASAGRVGRQGTWKKEHRRFSHTTPGQRKRRRLNLLVAVDVSDSTDVRGLREAFAEELVHIARGRDSRLTVLYAGSRIQRIETFRSSEAVAEVFEGGGFTDLRPVFDYARAMVPPPAAVIYLTDGEGPAPDEMAFPTLWVLTRKGRRPADWGVELRLDV